MSRQVVIFEDLGSMPYQQAWDYQEELLQSNLRVKSAGKGPGLLENLDPAWGDLQMQTSNYLLFVEHPPVYTLGKSGNLENLLIPEEGGGPAALNSTIQTGAGTSLFTDPANWLGTRSWTWRNLVRISVNTCETWKRS
jgi:lipoyl(octanoyl) transferase